MESKRMMSAKQDHYREHIVSKLLVKTHIQWINTGGRDDVIMNKDDASYRQLVITTPFKLQYYLLHSPKFKLPTWKTFDKVPAEFVYLMGEYAITGDEVQVVWEQYGSMVNKMIDGKHCRTKNIITLLTV